MGVSTTIAASVMTLLRQALHGECSCAMWLIAHRHHETGNFGRGMVTITQRSLKRLSLSDRMLQRLWISAVLSLVHASCPSSFQVAKNRRAYHLGPLLHTPQWLTPAVQTFRHMHVLSQTVNVILAPSIHKGRLQRFSSLLLLQTIISWHRETIYLTRSKVVRLRQYH